MRLRIESWLVWPTESTSVNLAARAWDYAIWKSSDGYGCRQSNACETGHWWQGSEMEPFGTTAPNFQLARVEIPETDVKEIDHI